MVDLELVPGQVVKTSDPVVRLKLAPGNYLVRLVVVSQSGARSLPAELRVRVRPG